MLSFIKLPIMQRVERPFFFLCFLFFFLRGMLFFDAVAASELATGQPVTVALIQEEEGIQPGRPFWVALRLNLEKEWHVYWKNPGDAGIPLKVEWKLPDGFEAGPLQWPFPEKFSVAEMVGFGYEEEVVLLSQITPSSLINSKFEGEIQASIKWLVCSALSCQPGSAFVSLPLKVSLDLPQKLSEAAPLFEKARSKIPRTDVEVKAIQREKDIQIEVPIKEIDSKNKAIARAYFFPEDKNTIDYSKDLSITKGSGSQCVTLKCYEDASSERSHNRIKGVLVLHSQKGSQEDILAIAIDRLIDAPSPLAFSDSLVSSSQMLTFDGGLGLAIFFAFLGGMILNLMPCVLPVVSFKVLGFVKMAGKSRSLTLRHGCMFSLGVLFSFWVLASVMLLLRAYGEQVGWGFQLQEPLFVVFLASILFLFALSLFGVFEMGMSISSWAGQTDADKKQNATNFTGSFLSGVLATAVATPCTGPFLGSAVGFAVTLPVFQSLLIFTFLALGMCFPYLLLSAFPSCLRFLPKPGAWMETFKQITGFIMLATVLWLLWVFSAQTDAFSLICLLGGLLMFSMGAWVFGKGTMLSQSKRVRIFAYAFSLLFAFMGIEAILLPRASWSADQAARSTSLQWDGWENFSPERVAELRRLGKPILIDFTAKWCLICQANHLVLSSDEVKKQMEDSGVVKMKADWTKSDPVITQELNKFGRSSVPLYILYGPEETEPLILPQVLTPETIAEHLEKAVPSDDSVALL